MTRLRAWLTGLTGWRRMLAAALLGALATAALPPVHALPLLVVAFTGLVWLIDGSASRRAAFALGWWFGLGHFVAGLYWFGHALMTDPERYAWLVLPAVFGISALLAVFPAGAALAARCSAAGIPRIVALALAWTAAELARGRVLTGFAWNPIGSAWTVSDAMIQSAAIFGVSGLGLVTVLMAALPATLGYGRRGIRRWQSTAAAALLLAVLWGGGAVRLAGANTGFVDDVLLRLVQANVAQHHKWKPALREALFARHLALSTGPGRAAVSHVIWPETALPYFIADDAERRRLAAQAAPPGGLLITGALRRSARGAKPFQIWNSMFAIDSAGAIVGAYDKFHLVPFGEYVPFRRFLPLTKLTQGSLDFSAGPGPRTLRLPGLPPVSPLICYEVIFPHRTVDPDDRPGFILNITNDAWFGTSSGPYQHFASARLRAVEQGLPVVRAANTGISGVIDAYGRVTARLGLNQTGVLDAKLPAAPHGATPYARSGDLSIALVLILGAGLLAGAGRYRRRSG